MPLGAVESPCPPSPLRGGEGHLPARQRGNGRNAAPQPGGSPHTRRTHTTSTGLTWLSAPGLGQEQGHRYSKEPYLGNGLADAVRAAVQGVPGRAIRTVFCSFNGESFGAKEWGVAAIRNAEALHGDFRLEHPADCFGDLGAAMAPVLVGLAALGLRKGYTPGPSLVWCASEGALRAASLVSSEPL
jgi:3-oxoacyl-[acyl-carrier-protein] synthase-1